tara:strand:- start:782 stop:4894 length:4113 start_codon:yes stop_codon:yes gene_type:complete
MKRLIVSLFFISNFGLGQSFVTIAEARALEVGTSATVRGIVTTPNYQATNTEYGLQDATAGIIIFRYGEVLTINVGDSVEVTGELDEWNGKFQIVPSGTSDITIISQNNPLPTFQVITVASLVANGEDYESELIRINGASITSNSWPTSNSANLDISDDGGTSTVAMRIDSDMDIIGNPEPAAPFAVQGIAGQYNYYQILPRYYTDFTPSPDLVINEFLASNDTCCADENGDYDDYIEIYNHGDVAVDIGGFLITDEIGSYDDYYQIPTGNDSTIIQPGSFLLLWADEESEQGVLHVEIKLSGAGEQIGLFLQDSTSAVDTLTFSEQMEDISYGRYPDGSANWAYFSTPSPGTANQMASSTINVPSDYSTIQAALNTAEDGDTVLVAAGTYVENIIWPATNGIKLIGIDESTTVIDGGQNASVIRFEDNENFVIDTTTIIQYLTITNGYAQGDWPAYYGGGIYCGTNASPKLSNVSIINNHAYWSGGGIYCESSDPVFVNLNISNNTTSTGTDGPEGSGGGALIRNSNAVFRNCLFNDNLAAMSGGIHCDWNTNPIISGCAITNNTATHHTGGINVNKTFTMLNSYVTDNIGTGIVVGGGDNASLIINCVIARNTGSGVENQADAHIINSTITGNIGIDVFDDMTGGWWYGGGLTNNGFINVINSIIWNNLPHEIANQDFSDDLNVSHSLIKGGLEEGVGEINWLDGNINLNPMFINPSDNNLHISDYSPCIGAGIDSIEINGVTFYASTVDIEGTSRPLPVNSAIDIGAYESYRDIPLVFPYQISEYATAGSILGGISLLNENSLYAVSSNDKVYRLDSNLNYYYYLDVDGGIKSASSITPDHTIYIASTDQNLYSFNSSGVTNPSWPRALGSQATASVAIDNDYNVYIGTANGVFQAVTPDNQSLWAYNTGASVYASACISFDNKLYVPAFDGRVLCFNLETIDQNSPSFDWILSTGAGIISSPALDTKINDSALETFIYLGLLDGRMVKISDEGSSASIVWQYQTGDSILTSPVIDVSGNIYFGSNDSSFYSISSDGELNWSIATGGKVRSTAAIDNNGITYFGSDDYKLYAVDSTGTIIWNYYGFSEISSPISIYNGNVYFGEKNGTIIKISPQNYGRIDDSTQISWSTFQGNNQRTGNQTDINLVNASPAEFSLIEPSNNAQITIDESNINTGNITFSWDESFDANGDSLYYFMIVTSAEISGHGMDTNATSFDLSYMDIIEDMSENNVTAASLEWTVYVTDGQDTVEADNAPYTIEIDGANALSAYLEGLLPDEFALHQNHPNPFNPVTTLRYDLPDRTHVNITVYDMLGRKVRTILNQQQDPGYKSLIWDATNDYGKPVSAGVYLYQIQAGEYINTKKMVLLK